MGKKHRLYQPITLLSVLVQRLISLRRNGVLSKRRVYEPAEINISRTSAEHILRKDRRLFPCKRIKQMKLTDLQRKEKKRIKFANWVLNNYTKEDINRFLFDLDGIYNAQNDRIWASSREEADKRSAVDEKNPILSESDSMATNLCSKLYDAGDGTMDAERYIEEVLLLAVKHPNKMLGKQ